MSSAYESSLNISFAVRSGLVIRQMHHWAADVFVGAIAVHMARIFFTGAFRKPRELNWFIGVTLLTLAIVEGFLGYSLPTTSSRGPASVSPTRSSCPSPSSAATWPPSSSAGTSPATG